MSRRRAWAPRGEALAAAVRAVACIVLAFALPCPATPELTLGALLPWRAGRLRGAAGACFGATLARLDAGALWRWGALACLALHVCAIAPKVPVPVHPRRPVLGSLAGRYSPG